MKEVSLESILEIVNANIENSEISLEQVDEDLSQQGMDSIKFIRIVISLEETFEIEIPDEKLLITEMRTLNKLLEVVIAETETESVGKQEESV